MKRLLGLADGCSTSALNATRGTCAAVRAHLKRELDSHAHTRDIVRVLRRRRCLDEVAHAELLGWRLRLNRFARAVDHRFLAA